MTGRHQRLSVADTVGLAGVTCLVAGLWMLHPAAGCIGAGIALGALAIELGKQESRGLGATVVPLRDERDRHAA